MRLSNGKLLKYCPRIKMKHQLLGGKPEGLFKVYLEARPKTWTYN